MGKPRGISKKKRKRLRSQIPKEIGNEQISKRMDMLTKRTIRSDRGRKNRPLAGHGC